MILLFWEFTVIFRLNSYQNFKLGIVPQSLGSADIPVEQIRSESDQISN